ncbi:MAG: hypothetical protein KF889_27950 [Alphaproteobacteria bacterium]|nr:hypothetical protein [Alphaproteobacteria bacterium]MCW5743790.1 hypothetical protein [Alphaproteobacteria bacterium]
MSEETLADLLDQGRLIHGIAGPLTVAGAIAVPVLSLLSKPPAIVLVAISVSVALGLAETLLALRVGFDAAALRRMAGHQDGASRFDAALAALGLAGAERAGRPMADRSRGCLRLLRLQAVAAILQVAALLGAGWMAAI